ncbi:MAG: hypothetical protein KC910_19160 [Candidatus Eremiobacteraeota bacterium]|nr:hypothetical protein [Candidatus Eremiobacteraeota bacterium]
MIEACYLGDDEGRIVAVGALELESVTVRYVDHRPQLDAEQTQTMEAACRRLRQRGMVVEPNPLYSVLASSVHEGCLELELGLTDYGQHVAFREHPEWPNRVDVLAAACVVGCPDGLIVERRSQKVAAQPGSYHVAPAGTVPPPQSLHQTLLAEAHEELGLEASELENLTCLGLVHAERFAVKMLVASCQTQVPLATMLARPREGSWEQTELLAAPCHPEQLPQWLAQRGSKLTSAGRAALLMEGRRRWGQTWFALQVGKGPGHLLS